MYFGCFVLENELLRESLSGVPDKENVGVFIKYVHVLAVSRRSSRRNSLSTHSSGHLFQPKPRTQALNNDLSFATNARLK